jgi:shikimate dehydrogenase
MTRKLYAIIGDPIAQARSPEVFNRLYAERGVNAEMVALHVSPAQLPTVLEGLAAIRNFGGAVITIPHKAAAAALAVQHSPRVQLAGVANALRRTADGWSADLFDGIGFVAGLVACGHRAGVASAAIVGAGGAGIAIATALLEAGAGQLGLCDIDAARAERARVRLSALWPGRVDVRHPSPCDRLVINATPVGMQPDDPLPFELSGLDPQAVIADAIMKPPRTRLLLEAARLGHPIHEGRHMLDSQAEALWRFLGMGEGT